MRFSLIGIDCIFNTLFIQSVFQRQEIVRRQFELKAKKEAEILAKRQQEQEQIKASTSTVQAPSLTPLISPTLLATHTQKPRPIAAVSNLLAIQKAKEKIEEIKAAKMKQQSFTAASTVAKGTTRVAHTVKVAEPTVKFSLFAHNSGKQ